MPFWYNIAPDFALGNRYYSSWAWEICKQNHDYLEYEIFDAYKWTDIRLGGTHVRNLHEILIKRNLKGEK